jgi:hypothetical protein
MSRIDDVNIVGRYGENSVDLEGSAESLRILSQAMQKPIRRETFSLEVPATPPIPYSGYCKSLTLECVEGPVRISRAAEQIVIAGSAEFLRILAGNIDFLADQQDTVGSIPHHLHIEYYEDDYFLDKKSTPLVVTKRG